MAVGGEFSLVGKRVKRPERKAVVPEEEGERIRLQHNKKGSGVTQ